MFGNQGLFEASHQKYAKSIAFQMLAPKIGEFCVICCVLILRFCASRADIEHADLDTFDMKDTVRDII